MTARETATDADAEAQADGSKLRRRISGPLLYGFILGDVLGAGVYALMGTLAQQVGGAVWVPLLVALLLALLTAGSYAELVTKYPRAGGAAIYARRAYRSPLVGFVVGFCMLAAGVVSAAGLALAFAGDYLSTFIDVPRIPAAMVVLVLIACLNARGIRESLRSNAVMTAIEVSGLVAVVVAVAVMLGGGRGDPTRVLDFRDGVSPALAVLGAAVLAYYSFVGFETSANVAEEVRRPARVYPRALFGALITAGAMYALVGIASSIALSPDRLARSSGPLLAVFRATGVAVPGWLFSLVALIAIANGALLTMIMASRVTFGMAEDGLLPAPLGRVLPKRHTPWVAIVVTTAVAVLLTLVGDLATLARTVVLLLLVVFLSTNVAVLVLRRDRVEHDHFRIWAPVPVLGAASCILLMTQQSPDVWLFGGLLVAAGLVLYAGSRWTRRRASGAASAAGAESGRSAPDRIDEPGSGNKGEDDR